MRFLLFFRFVYRNWLIFGTKISLGNIFFIINIFWVKQIHATTRRWLFSRWLARTGRKTQTREADQKQLIGRSLIYDPVAKQTSSIRRG